jgi:hypothetical protein
MQNKSLVSLVSLLVLGVVAACGPDDPPPNNGVNDVEKACEIRIGWANRGTVACTDCLSISQAPKCDCPDFQQEFAAKCHEQARARTNEPTCDGVPKCVGDCDPTDCACTEACFAGKERCREVSSAAEGCTTDVCDAYCR